MNKLTIYLTIFNIGVCIESLIRVGYCICPVVIASLLTIMLLIGVKSNKTKFN